MKQPVIVVTGDKVLRVPKDVWAAFLAASSLVVDTGDMYPHMEKDFGAKLLDSVKAMKSTLDDHCQASSS